MTQMKVKKAATSTVGAPTGHPKGEGTNRMLIFTLAVPVLLFAYIISSSLYDLRPTLDGKSSIPSLHKPTTPAPALHLDSALTPRQRAMSDKGEKTVVGNTTYHPSFGLFPKVGLGSLRGDMGARAKSLVTGRSHH